MGNKKFISTTELAKLLGVSRIAVYKQIKSGKIKAEKVGRGFVIDKRDLGGIFSKSLTKSRRRKIDKAVEKTVREYGETLRLLGRA